MNYPNTEPNQRTREWLTGQILPELINGFNFNVGIEDKLEDKIDELIKEAISIADKTCALLNDQKFPPSTPLQWLNPSQCQGQHQWISLDLSLPVPNHVCLLSDEKGNIFTGYYHPPGWYRIDHVSGERTKTVPTHWLPIFFFPKPNDDTDQT